MEDNAKITTEDHRLKLNAGGSERKSESRKVPILNGYLVGLGRDMNGNKIAKFRGKDGKGFSIQTLINLPTLHRADDIRDLSIQQTAEIEAEVEAYIQSFGTRRQREILLEWGSNLKKRQEKINNRSKKVKKTRKLESPRISWEGEEKMKKNTQKIAAKKNFRVVAEDGEYLIERGDIMTIIPRKEKSVGAEFDDTTDPNQGDAVIDQPEPTVENPNVGDYEYDTDGADDPDQIIDPSDASTDDPADSFESDFDTDRADDPDQVIERARRRRRALRNRK